MSDLVQEHGEDGASAIFNTARTHRFVLTRDLHAGHTARIVWVMLNPSTADAFKLDPTIQRCMAFSRRWGFGSLAVVNLFALRSPHPSDLLVPGNSRLLKREAIDPPELPGTNDAFIEEQVSLAEQIVCAWGNHGELGDRWRTVLANIRRTARGPVDAERLLSQPELADGFKGRVTRLGFTQSGQPKHPLARGKERIDDDVEPQVWS